MENAVSTQQLTRRFRSGTAVSDLSIQIPEGSVYGLLGPNGAGKTTTLHMLLNLLQPSEGSAQVLGVDSRRLKPRHFERIGYVSEEQKLPAWMTVERLIAFCRPLYPCWDDAFCQQLLARFELPLKQRLRTLSRGMRVKAALLTALAPRPRLLVLDEPFSGLDALVRDEMVRAVLELAGSEGWTVLVSSHDLADLENLLDRVAFLNQGKLVLEEGMDALRERFRSVIVPLPSGGSDQVVPHPTPPEWLRVEAGCGVLRFVHSDFRSDELESQLERIAPGAGRATVDPMSLREIFVALASSRPGGAERRAS